MAMKANPSESGEGLQMRDDLSTFHERILSRVPVLLADNR